MYRAVKVAAVFAAAAAICDPSCPSTVLWIPFWNIGTTWRIYGECTENIRYGEYTI